MVCSLNSLGTHDKHGEKIFFSLRCTAYSLHLSLTSIRRHGTANISSWPGATCPSSLSPAPVSNAPLHYLPVFQKFRVHHTDYVFFFVFFLHSDFFTTVLVTFLCYFNLWWSSAARKMCNHALRQNKQSIRSKISQHSRLPLFQTDAGHVTLGQPAGHGHMIYHQITQQRLH